MNENRWMKLGERLLDAGGPRQRARLLVDQVPSTTLAGLGLTRNGSTAAIALGAFAVGAVLGAGAVIFFAPGSEVVRQELSVELERTKRLARRAAGRARKRGERAVAQATNGLDDLPLNERHDAHA